MKLKKFMYTVNKQRGCFAELKLYVANKLQYDINNIFGIRLENTEVVIEDDNDVFQLREDETVEIILGMELM